MAFKDRLLGNPVVATILAVQKRTKADAADQFAASIGFFGFVSLIPLIVIAVAITGLVVGDDPVRIADIATRIGNAIPGLASNEGLQSTINGIVDNGGSIGLIGGVTLLLAGLRVTNSLQTATRFVFDMPLAEAKALRLRVWQLASLVILGVLALAGVAVTSTAASITTTTLGERFGIGAAVAAFAIGGVLDILLFWVAYRIYTIGGVASWRQLLPGAILGGLGWALLKSFGATYASRQAAGIEQNTGAAAGADPNAGAAAAAVIASIIGLLLLFYLAGRLYVYGAELSATMMGLKVDERVATRATSTVEDDAIGTVDEVDEADTTDVADRDVDARDRDDRRADTSGSLADRFKERGALIDPSVVEPTPDGTGTEIVPWQAPEGSRLDDRRTRQAAAFAASAVAVVTAGLLGRRR